MSATLWAEMDDYIVERLLPADPVLEEALAASTAAGLPAISVSAAQGQMLHLFARMIGAKRILEIGTLGGYSAIFLARALPADGKLVTLEFEPRHAEVAAANLARAGLSDKVDLRVGRAIDTLPKLEAEGQGPFDLVFIDADKPSNPDYLHWALRLSRPGTVIICDNVVRSGKVLDAESTDANVIGVRRLFDLAGADPRLSATAVQTVGAKGYDGFALLRVE
ncbi:O-methyltransferase [Xanthobacter autotrophicus]|jgi:predicted O-methyltransferase YrrM|uniref:O-methyltransferase n=1 Tax=Xanthobacter autotrophicus TaxID=280 RepID=A0A6C1KW43_XANAU|nr:O-methyltransferase [Xanthobacter autotrophicus]TLX43673.1 O-methyltransferase [Xanthobacter autotrophicus]